MLYNKSQMEQNKKSIVIAVVVTAVVVIALGTGGLFAYTKMNKKVVLNNGAASYDSSSLSANAGSSATDQSTASGLSVTDGTSNGAQSLGQLSGSSSAGAQGTSQGGSSNSSNSSSSQSIDPSTFGQYEQYKDKTQALFGDIQVGTGATIGQTSKVAVYYKGWLTNGQMFDQSRTGSDGKLQPFIFTMGAHSVITGWEQAIYGMKVGGTRLIVVPPSVGYGSTAQGSIPANSVLVFQVQVLDAQ